MLPLSLLDPTSGDGAGPVGVPVGPGRPEVDEAPTCRTAPRGAAAPVRPRGPAQLGVDPARAEARTQPRRRAPPKSRAAPTPTSRSPSRSSATMRPPVRVAAARPAARIARRGPIAGALERCSAASPPSRSRCCTDIGLPTPDLFGARGQRQGRRGAGARRRSRRRERVAGRVQSAFGLSHTLTAPLRSGRRRHRRDRPVAPRSRTPGPRARAACVRGAAQRDRGRARARRLVPRGDRGRLHGPADGAAEPPLLRRVLVAPRAAAAGRAMPWPC